METVKAVIKYDERKDTSVTPDTSIVKHAVCAVSGGMDSATCLFHAVKLYGKENVIGVSMYYGQRHDVELQKAKAECEKQDVPCITVENMQALGKACGIHAGASAAAILTN